jgi:hypothetical protein
MTPTPSTLTTTTPTVATTAQRPGLPAVLLFDAATGVLMGAALLALTAPLATLFGLPPTLLRWAGLLLIPFAVLMVVSARQRPPSATLLMLVVAGNLAWVAASFGVLIMVEAITTLGTAFVLLQAAAVLVLAALEWRGLRRPGQR